MPELVNELAARTGGTPTSHQRIKPDDFTNLLLILPESAMIERLAEVTAPRFFRIRILRLRNATLRQVRSLLLPKIVSGDVDMEAICTSESGESVIGQA